MYAFYNLTTTFTHNRAKFLYIGFKRTIYIYTHTLSLKFHVDTFSYNILMITLPTLLNH